MRTISKTKSEIVNLYTEELNELKMTLNAD